MPFAAPGQTIVTRGGRRVVIGSPAPSFTPWFPVPEIQSKVLGHWDASRPSTIKTEAGGLVTEWRDTVHNLPLHPHDDDHRPEFTPGEWGVDFDNLDSVYGDIPGLTHDPGKELWAVCHANSPDPRESTSAVACVIRAADPYFYNVFSINRNAYTVEPFQRPLLRFTRGNGSMFVALRDEWPTEPTLMRATSEVNRLTLTKDGTETASRDQGGEIPVATGVCIGGEPKATSNAFIGRIACVTFTELLTEEEAATFTAYMMSRLT